MKLELDLTPDQHQQLLECYFAGMLVIEELYPDSVVSIEIGSKLHREAKRFGKENLVFNVPELRDTFTVSQEVEGRILPVLYREG